VPEVVVEEEATKYRRGTVKISSWDGTETTEVSGTQAELANLSKKRRLKEFHQGFILSTGPRLL
jgi:hypothetical protein